MIYIAGSVSLQRTLSLTPSAFALISCGVAWVKDHATIHRRRLAAALAVLHVALLLDMAFNARWLLHDLLAAVAKADNLYIRRSGPQHVAIALVASAVVGGAASVLWIFRGRPGAALAACGGILSLCFWCVEVISLHGLDRLLYHRVDGVMVISLVWTLCSMMTGMGILWDAWA